MELNQGIIVPVTVQNADGTTGAGEVHFDRQGLLPAVVQESGTNEVLLVAFMNREAFELTCHTGRVHFWSRRRRKLWLKGETSGDYLLVDSLHLNCEDNSILVRVTLAGKAACHTGNKACYYRQILPGEAPTGE